MATSLVEAGARVDAATEADDFVLGTPREELTPEQVRQSVRRYDAITASTGNRHLSWLIWLLDETRHCVDDFLDHHLSGPCEDYGGPCAFCRETKSRDHSRIVMDLNGILWALESAVSQVASNIHAEEEPEWNSTSEGLRMLADRAEELERAYGTEDAEQEEAGEADDDAPEPVAVAAGGKPR